MNKINRDTYKVPYFPSIDEYDLNTAVGQILYLAHLDLEPMGGLIDYSDRAEKDYSQFLIDTAQKANDENDMITYSLCMDREVILQAKIIPLGNDALLVMMMSVLEETFNTWCRCVKINEEKKGNNIPALAKYVPSKQKKARGLDKAIYYLKEFADIDSIKQDRAWGYIDAMRTARNMIVHNGGRVKESARTKMNQFNIGMRGEDYSLYIDHETIKEMYEEIIGFVDRVMKHP